MTTSANHNARGKIPTLAKPMAAAKPTPPSAPAKPSRKKQTFSDAEIIARARANEVAREKRKAERDAMAPRDRAVQVADRALGVLGRAERYLARFDGGTGVITNALSAVGDSMIAIGDHLKSLPSDFAPSRSRSPGRTARTYAEGAIVYIRTETLASLGKHFSSAGPHTVIESTPDGEFVMLQGSRYTIGVPRKSVSELTPAEQEKARAEWLAKHPRKSRG